MGLGRGSEVLVTDWAPCQNDGKGRNTMIPQPNRTKTGLRSTWTPMHTESFIQRGKKCRRQWKQGRSIRTSSVLRFFQQRQRPTRYWFQLLRDSAKNIRGPKVGRRAEEWCLFLWYAWVCCLCGNRCTSGGFYGEILLRFSIYLLYILQFYGNYIFCQLLPWLRLIYCIVLEE